MLYILALLAEFVDSYLGMMYGTILTPLLIIVGFPSQDVVPSILLSQAIAGGIASIGHIRYNNITLKRNGTDTKIILSIVTLGLIAVVVGALVGTLLPKEILNTYIAILCIVMGLIIVTKRTFNFSWMKIYGIAIISSFNKALSGGGFGPVVTSGQIISGRKGKSSISVSDITEIPICLLGFGIWVASKGMPDTSLLFPLIIGSVVGALIGPFVLSKHKSSDKLKITIGYVTLILGTYLLGKCIL